MSFALTPWRSTPPPQWVNDPLWLRARQVPVFDVNYTNRTIVDTFGIVPTYTRTSSTKLLWNGTAFQSYVADVPGYEFRNGIWQYVQEVGATNIILNSENILNVGGTKSVVASVIGPGNMTVYREDTSSGEHRLETSINSLNGVTGNYVHSVRFRPIGRRYIWFRPIALNDANPPGWIVIDTQLDTITNTGSPVASKLRRLSSEWLEMEIAITLGGGSTLNQWRVQTMNGSNTISFVGDPAKGVDIYIPQVETGVGASSPIITTGTAVARTGDLMTWTGTNFSSWFPTGDFTVYTEYFNKDVSGQSFLWGIDNSITGVGVDEVRPFESPGGSRSRGYASSNVLQFNPGGLGTVADDVLQREVLAVGLNNSTVGGALFSRPATDTSCVLPVGMNRMSLGMRGNASFRGKSAFRRFAIFAGRLADTRLDALVA